MCPHKLTTNRNLHLDSCSNCCVTLYGTVTHRKWKRSGHQPPKSPSQFLIFRLLAYAFSFLELKKNKHSLQSLLLKVKPSFFFFVKIQGFVSCSSHSELASKRERERDRTDMAASQEYMDKMQLRQNYRNLWHTDLLGTIQADTPCTLAFSLTFSFCKHRYTVFCICIRICVFGISFLLILLCVSVCVCADCCFAFFW